MIWFAIASLSPLALLGVAVLLGGIWPLLALITLTLLVALLDQIPRQLAPQSNDRSADLLSITLALGHLALLLSVPSAVTQMPWPQAVTLMLALALFMGQVSHPNAHELIHHPSRPMRRLGAAVYTTLLIGHHVSAHLRVHHVLVATSRDPNSAHRGEGFYRFFARAWVGSFRAGLRADTGARARKSSPPRALSHPYIFYAGGALLVLAGVWGSAGLAGVLIFLVVAVYAQAQIFLADYVQHYGLVRRCDAAGRVEPVGPAHSWNAPHWYSSAMMLSAPRHSDHHLHPKRRYPALQLDPGMPVLPHALPVMAVIALVPPLWHRVMAPRLDQLAEMENMA